MLDEILSWLRATIEGDKAAAEAATQASWSYDPGKIWLDGEDFVRFDLKQGMEFVGYGGPSPFRGCVATLGPSSDPQSMRDAEHIARHDPQDTITRCQAELAELDLFERERAEHPSPRSWDYESARAVARNGALEDVLRLRAYGYRRRPGWQERWAPSGIPTE